MIRRLWLRCRRALLAVVLAFLVGGGGLALPTTTAQASTPAVAQLSINLGVPLSGDVGQWTYRFTTPGGLPAGTVLWDEASPGVTFPSNPQDYSLYIGNTKVPVTFDSSMPGFGLVLQSSVPAQTQLTLIVTNVTNPTVPSGQASLPTSVWLGAQPPGPVFASFTYTTVTVYAPYLPLALTTTSSLGGASGVTWTFQFQTNEAFPAGTNLSETANLGAVFSSNPQDYVLTADNTPVPFSFTGNGSTFTLTLQAAVAQGATIQLVAYDTTNPTVPAGQSALQVSVALLMQSNLILGGPDIARTSVTFQSPTSVSATGSPPARPSPTLDLGQPMAPLPPASLPGSDSTASSFSPYTLRFDNQGDTLNGATPSNSQTLDTQVTTINGNKVITTVGSNTYYLTNAAAVEIPVQCTSNPNWVSVCNVKVEDANNNPWPNVQVINPNGGTVSLTLGTANGSGSGPTFTLSQVAVNTTAQPATVPVVSPQSDVPQAANNSLDSPDYIGNSAWGPVNAPGGLTLAPMPDCSGGVGTASATLLIPLNGVSAQVKIVTTEVSAMLSSLSGDLFIEVGNQGGLSAQGQYANIWPSNNCAYEGYVGMFLLSTHTSGWAGVLNTGLQGGSYNDVNNLTAASAGSNQVDAFVEYSDSRTLNLAQLPLSEVQLSVMPYKILYQPPGDNSHSEFTLSQGNTSQTDFTIAQENTSTTAVNNSTSWNIGLSGDEVGSLSVSGTWDQSTTQATTNSTSSGQSEAWVSEEDQQWQSYTSANNNGLPQLDTPGTQPWLYDEFVLQIHPQFAIYDGYWCQGGGTACGNGQGSSSGSPPAQGTTMWTLLGAEPTQFDVRAGDLLACAQGTAIPIPNTNPAESLTPAQCAGLLKLDPFAAAGAQSLDPSSTSAAGAIGSLAIPVENYSAGMPGEGTNGSYMVQLSQTQETTNSSEQTSSFTATVDASLTNTTDISAGVGPPVLQPTGGVTFEQQVSSGQSVTVTYTQSQTASQVTQEAASATLSDLMNPIDTAIFLDTRWDTLMFQVPLPVVSSLTPASGLGSGGFSVQVAGNNFYGGPVAVQFCPSGSTAGCISATQASVSSDTALTVTGPPLSPGTYCLQVVDAGGASACTAATQFTVVTPQQEVQANGVTVPIVSSVSPASGPAGGGTAVTLTGANLNGVQQVWFGTSDPQANPGLYSQYLQAGSASGLPTLAPAPFTVLNDSQIVACAPPVAGPETVWVAVYGPAGWSNVTPADQFSYAAGAGSPCTPSSTSQTSSSPPVVTAVGPSSGPLTGGTMVTVTGSGFADVQQPVACAVYGCQPGATTTLLVPPKVQFCAPNAVVCSQATNVQVQSGNTLLVQAPPSEIGPGRVDVEVLGPGGWSAPGSGDQFTYTAAPVGCGSTASPCSSPGSLALGVNPPTAAAGLEAVQVLATVLNGSGNPLANVPVTFSASGAQLSVTQAVYTDSGGLASASLTAADPGSVSVVAEVYGQPDLLNRTAVSFEPVPIVTGLSTTSGPIGGGTMVTVHGLGFSGATTVYVGNTAVTNFTVAAGGTSLTFTTPPGLGTVDVRVANPAAISGTGPWDQFTYQGLSAQAPQVTAISPASGPAAGGTDVVITGTGFTGASAVLFGSTPASTFTVTSDSQITAVAPAGSGTVTVTVVTPNGESAASPDGEYTYVAPIGSVTRTLAAGWNTLSVPFPLSSSDNSLASILSDQGNSVAVALTYACTTSQQAATGNCWQQVTGTLPKPMQGLFIELHNGSGPVTATLVPASGLNNPPQYALQPGWNLVGPSALDATESDQAFLAGIPPATLPLLVDPNGSPQAVVDPGADTTHTVQNGYAYWLFAEAPGATLAGQIPTGSVNP